MKNTKFTILVLSLVLSSLLLITCKKDKVEKTVDTSSISTVFTSSGVMLTVPTIRQEDTTVSHNFSEEDTAVWKCTKIKYNVFGASGGSEGYPEYSPNSSITYPGALLQGKSIESGTPSAIVLKRAGGTISWDIVNGTKSSSKVDEISKSSVYDAMNKILDTTKNYPANFTLQYQSIYSENHLKFELGIGVNNKFTDIKASFGFDYQSTKNSVLVKLKQSYFTMSFDLPTSLDQLFDPSVTPTELAKYVQPSNPATYISDVTYGRIYYMLFQSSSSITDMKAAIDASFKGLTKVDVNAKLGKFSNIKNMNLTVKGYGGDAKTTLATAGNSTEMDKLLLNLVEGGTIGSGKPLSYVIRNVVDNEVVATKLATDYDVVNCELVISHRNPPVWLEHWHGANGILAKFGNGVIGALMQYGNKEDKNFIIFNQDGTKFLESKSGILSSVFDTKDLISAAHLNLPLASGKGNPLLSSSGIGSAAYTPNYLGLNNPLYSFNTTSGQYINFWRVGSEWYSDTLKENSLASKFVHTSSTIGQRGIIEAMTTAEKYGANFYPYADFLGVDFSQTLLGLGTDNAGKISDNWPWLVTGKVEDMTHFWEGKTVETYIWVLGGSNNGDIPNGRFYCVGQKKSPSSNWEFTTVDLKK